MVRCPACYSGEITIDDKFHCEDCGLVFYYKDNKNNSKNRGFSGFNV